MKCRVKLLNLCLILFPLRKRGGECSKSTHISVSRFTSPVFSICQSCVPILFIRATTASAFQQTLALPPRQLVRIKMAIRHGRFKNDLINSAQ